MRKHGVADLIVQEFKQMLEHPLLSREVYERVAAL
jgi:uncharacterized protein YqgQ